MAQALKQKLKNKDGAHLTIEEFEALCFDIFKDGFIQGLKQHTYSTAEVRILFDKYCVKMMGRTFKG